MSRKWVTIPAPGTSTTPLCALNDAKDRESQYTLALAFLTLKFTNVTYLLIFSIVLDYSLLKNLKIH